VLVILQNTLLCYVLHKQMILYILFTKLNSLPLSDGLFTQKTERLVRIVYRIYLLFILTEGFSFCRPCSFQLRIPILHNLPNIVAVLGDCKYFGYEIYCIFMMISNGAETWVLRKIYHKNILLEKDVEVQLDRSCEK
jgi:hypothetical protein